MPASIRKALTFRASSIGDCLMGKYLLENVHTRYPQARLGIVMAGRAGMIRDLFAAYPWLEVIEANRRNPRSVLSLWRNFYGSDLVVTQYAGKKGGRFGLASKLIARALAKKGGLIGFSDTSRWNSILYDRLIPVRSDIAVAEHERAALRAAGFPIVLPFPALECVQNAAVLTAFRLEAGKYIVAHFFSGAAGRGMSPEKSRELLIALRRTLPEDISIVVSGARADRESALAIANDVEAKVIAGEATLQDMMNLIQHSRAVVSVDTGMAHIAAQLGRPLVVMSTCLWRNWWFPEQYGASAPVSVFSRNDLCTSGHVYKDYPVCINEIDVKEVALRVAAVTQ
ncbi:hypothetical protein A3G12_01580 [Candidatus Kaiserbacteria bacterium RIFCSPLOWO2_12_FULL_54_10]|nr:MAG: hypothetical protein A3G12_01580 [Candidatus Kaiserbacteria bacterium RIFCSPLOWO2_12_FULL_54_10]